MIFKFFNILFRSFLIFLICLVWTRYFIRDFGLAITYTAILTVAIEFMLHFLLSKKNAKNNLKEEEQKLADKISATFVFSSQDAINYFYKLSKINYSAKKTSKFVIITQKNSKNLEDSNTEQQKLENDTKNKTILYPFYSYSPINAQGLVDIIKRIEKQKPTKLIVCGYKIDNETYKLATKIKDFKIILLNSKDCFVKLIKPHNFYPENLRELSLTPKLKFKEILALSVSRQRTKGYLIGAFFLLFSSFIVRMNIYYVIMSSLFLLLALTSFFLPQKQNKFEQEIL